MRLDVSGVVAGGKFYLGCGSANLSLPVSLCSQRTVATIEGELRAGLPRIVALEQAPRARSSSAPWADFGLNVFNPVHL